jgi:agmatine deiminase
MTTLDEIRLPAEWEPQDAVLLAWPREGSLWQPYLEEAREAVARIAAEISRRQRVVLAAHDPAGARQRVARHGADLGRLAVYELQSNDVWARDFGPITVLEGGRPVLLDFRFNGWGLKYRADLDNQVTSRLAALGAFGRTPLRGVDLVLEGGSLESDGNGTLLTTALCLANANRNPHLNRSALDAELRRHFGARRVLWLENGYLTGDDTDGHVDTLARFAPGDTIVFTRCADARDEHHERLKALEAELRAFRTLAGRPYRLVPLPWPQARYDGAQRLPLTYANFLVLNGAVLVPAYGDPADAAAREAVGSAFPDREVVAMDCSCLIRQRGAVHCLTMQLPKGVLG